MDIYKTGNNDINLEIKHVFVGYIWNSHQSMLLSCLITASEASLQGMDALQWRHNEHNSVSNHQPRDCLLNRLFGHRSKKTSKLRVTGLCAGNSPGPVNSPHKWPVTRKMFPFDDVIMGSDQYQYQTLTKLNKWNYVDNIVSQFTCTT